MKTKIVKYELYPEEQPTSYAVGFDIILQNSRSFYIDTLVSLEGLESGLADEEIAKIGFTQLEEEINDKIEQLTYSELTIKGMDFDVDSQLENSSIEFKKKIDELNAIMDVIIGNHESEVEEEEPPHAE